MAPISDNVKYPNYKINNKRITNDNPDCLSVDSVDGYAMLINKKKIFQQYLFWWKLFLIFRKWWFMSNTKKGK